jgi:hypothetical protein
MRACPANAIIALSVPKEEDEKIEPNPTAIRKVDRSGE